ncbi:hypothetical protein BST13_35765 [Mycobacterium aquaticum]|uniref:Tryptophanase n=1 Tax=Mycobacterium aquaticum TaxID=1927124 RepID=A0A1W9ZYM0_9MYCO|nr:hypothetical protein BST13_35765 [Mycobacterium aquaticum]
MFDRRDWSGVSNSEVAWLLADVARPCLRRRERQLIYLEIGGGDPAAAVEVLLQKVVQRDFPLPIGVRRILEIWLDAYTGAAEEPRLRSLLRQMN